MISHQQEGDYAALGSLRYPLMNTSWNEVGPVTSPSVDLCQGFCDARLKDGVRMTNSDMSSQSAEWGDESHMVTELKRDRGSARFGSVGLLDERCWGRDVPWLLLAKDMVCCL